MRLPLPSGAWSLDPAHSVVEFSVRHLGISTIRGRFVGIEATMQVGDDLSSSSLSAEIDMSTVDTGDANRDGHLRSSDIFDVERQPKMTFTSTAIADQGGGRYTVVGDMTINGTTRSETLDVEFAGTGSNPLDGSTRAGFSATGHIDRTAYGVDWNVPLPAGGFMLSNDIDLTLHAQLIGPSSD
jgi:polyisoprenoid-binding protein YceI